MKQQRLRFKILALFLFSLLFLLALYGGWNVLTYGNRWFASNRNPRVRAQKEQVIAGDILDRDGVVLARTSENGNRVYQPEAKDRMAVVHLLGDRQGQVSNGVESFQTSYLYGFNVSFPERVLSLFTGQSRKGDTVQLTVSAALTTALAESFGLHESSAGKRGAAVIMNWKTGEVLAMTSLPSFDPDNITDATRADPGQPFWNRATQSVYPPGSTFKTITAATALKDITDVDSIIFTCTSDVLDFGSSVIADYGGEAHGNINIRQAFIYSCNKMFANLAFNAGQRNMLAGAKRFGFNDNFLFRDLVVENSSYPEGNLTDYELAACGFGQSSIAATPLHMCMVAAGIANDGVMMEPRLLLQVTSPSGRSRLNFTSSTYRTCVSRDIALTLQEYMRQVVTEGTGRRAAVSGLTVCGKTGTADSTLDGEPITYGWFIGYISEEELPYAICVVVENLDSGTSGGSVAAPIAADAFAWIRDHWGSGN